MDGLGFADSGDGAGAVAEDATGEYASVIAGAPRATADSIERGARDGRAQVRGKTWFDALQSRRGAGGFGSTGH